MLSALSFALTAKPQFAQHKYTKNHSFIFILLSRSKRMRVKIYTEVIGWRAFDADRRSSTWDGHCNARGDVCVGNRSDFRRPRRPDRPLSRPLRGGAQLR